MHGFGKMTSMLTGSYLVGRWAHGILDEYGRLLDDFGNMHSIKCPSRHSGKNFFKPELASFIQGGKICDDNPDAHSNCVRYSESAKSLIALSMYKVHRAEERALAAFQVVQDKETVKQMLKYADIKFQSTDSDVAQKFGMSESIYSVSNLKTDQSSNYVSSEYLEEPVSAAVKVFACASHVSIGDPLKCVCVVKAMEVRRLIALFSSVNGDEVIELVHTALSDATPLAKFDSVTLEYDICSEKHGKSDVEDDENFERSFFLCGPVFHKACHSLRTFYGLKMWKWYKSMRWFRLLKNSKSLNRTMRSVYGDGEFTERSESSFFSRWMIPDDSRPQTARSFLETSQNDAVEINRIRQALSVYIDPVYYEKPPEMDELENISIRATAAYDGYAVEIFEDELQLISRIPSKRAIFDSAKCGTLQGTALQNTPKSVVSSASSAPSGLSTKRGKKLTRTPPDTGKYNSLYSENKANDDLPVTGLHSSVVHSRPGSAVRFIQPEALISTLVAGASVLNSKSITNFASKQKHANSDENDQEAVDDDDDNLNFNNYDDNRDGNLTNDDADESDLMGNNWHLPETEEDLDDAKAAKNVKMLLRDGFTHYGLHLQWDLREIPSFETHRNCDIFESSENVSVTGSESSSLPSTYAKLLFF
jgi:hypothetical protein